MNDHEQTWSAWDDVMLKAWMAIYENSLTPPLIFHVVNGWGERVSVSSLDIKREAVQPWWSSWSYIPPVTIQVEDACGKRFELRLPTDGAP